MKKISYFLLLFLLIFSTTSCKKNNIPKTIEETNTVFSNLENLFSTHNITLFENYTIDVANNEWQYIPSGAQFKVYCQTTYGHQFYGVYFGDNISDNSINEFKILMLKMSFGNMYDDCIDDMINGHFPNEIQWNNEFIDGIICSNGWIYSGDELLVCYFEGRITGLQYLKTIMKQYS